jgi:hypothetical protein
VWLQDALLGIPQNITLKQKKPLSLTVEVMVVVVLGASKALVHLSMEGRCSGQQGWLWEEPM